MLQRSVPLFKHPPWAARIDESLADGIVTAVSASRLDPFGLSPARGRDAIGAVARHGRNIRLSEATYPVLHLLEVVMRNAIHDAFRAHYGANDWYAQAWLAQGHRRLVADAQAELIRQRKVTTPDRTVAALGFGFWCAMFHAHYESASGPWPTLLGRALPRVPKTWRTRDRIKTRVEEARHLRNRVFHHEPIIHIPDLPTRHRRLVELLGWFSPAARRHVEDICRFRATFGEHLVHDAD